MKKLICVGSLLWALASYSQTIHSVTVAVNQGEGCPTLTALDSSDLFSVFPNPAKSSITVQSVIEKASLRLVDFQGKEVREEEIKNGTLTIDIQDLAKGIYVLFLDHKNGSESIKVKVQ